MKIKKILIQNFRSIEKVEIELSNFNIFVGQNNAGKTNFFEAVEWFYKGLGKGADINLLKHKRSENLEIRVEVLFMDVESGLAKMENAKNQATLKNQLDGMSEVWIFRTSSESGRRLRVDGVEVKPGTGFDKALNDFLPKFEYIHTKQYHDELLKYKKGTPIAEMLSDVLGEILKHNQTYQDFKKKFQELFESEDSIVAKEFSDIGNSVQSYLAKQFSDADKVTFNVDSPVIEDLLKKFQTQIDDGVECAIRKPRTA